MTVPNQNERVLDQFTQQASAYAALVDAQAAPRVDPLIAFIQPAPAHRVLDVGCGSGQFAVAIAPMVASVTGVDLTPAMLDQARAHAAACDVSNVRWLVADSSSLPIKDGSFDVVVSRSMFHHAADPAATLAEMRRACVPSGRLFVSDLSPDPTKAPAFDAIELLRDPSHSRALSFDELRNLGRQLGLSEIVATTSGTSLPLEAVLTTSFPPAGMLDHVRALLARDATTMRDVFGLKAELKDATIWVTYPTMVFGWQAD